MHFFRSCMHTLYNKVCSTIRRHWFTPVYTQTWSKEQSKKKNVLTKCLYFKLIIAYPLRNVAKIIINVPEQTKERYPSCIFR